MASLINVELYDALVKVGAEDLIARAAASSVPTVSEFAPKGDLAGLKVDFAKLQSEMAKENGQLASKMAKENGKLASEMAKENGKLASEMAKTEARFMRSMVTLVGIVVVTGGIMISLFLSRLP